MIRLSLIAASLVAALALPALAQQSPIEVSNAWARATPPGAQAGAAYVTVTNKGSVPDRLLGASTPIAGSAQLHTMTDDNGVMKMRPVAGVDLKPGASVTLKPGGLHVMLTELKQPLKAGDRFPIELDFEKAGKIATTATVAKAGAMQSMDMKDMPGMK